jgi:diguanylate cyclase (GGDEF)-like protein
MDESAARERNTEQVQPDSALASWEDAQNSLAAASGLAVLLIDGPQPPALAISNNNSICYAFQSSETHKHLCEPYCGVAFERAMDAREAVNYQCHAGLHCVSVPVELGKKRKLAVIGGRTFLTSADYRALAERFRVGDLQELLSSDLFKNVIFAARQDLVDLSRRVLQAAEEFRSPVKERSSARSSGSPRPTDQAIEVKRQTPSRTASAKVPASGPIDDICRKSIRALADRYQLGSIALLLRTRDGFAPSVVTGRFTNQPINITIEGHDERLLDAARRGSSLLMSESSDSVSAATNTPSGKRSAGRRHLELFPLAMDGELKAAMLIADAELDNEKRNAIAEFCREIALPLEVLRLRDELSQRARYADSLQTFTSLLDKSDPKETYQAILQHSAELLRAERSSLLVYYEASNEMEVKASIGLRPSVTSTVRIRLGDGVAGDVLQQGRPLVVNDLRTSGRAPAPSERRYKTHSFISYPISIGGRKMGVLNMTDKAGGGAYDQADLGVLETIAPQLALALDRADWQEKATQFQLMSITDALTGMLNRRYLEERLAEELRRSERQNFSMGFMMIDIDDFKYYNDQNGHQAGDLALEMTAQCLKSVLRGADVASRYGGEEFCILLPQTTLEEAVAIAQRIRRRVERTRFPHGKTQPLGTVTVSIGVSALNETTNSPAAIILAADRALYDAKRLGKNNVQVLASDPTDSTTPDVNHSST